VRVCGDGMELPEFPADGAGVRFSGMVTERVGVAEAKNILLRGRPAEVVIFANSDTRPESGFVAAHVRRLAELERNEMVLGSTLYEQAGEATVFDVLKEETPMIFFYRQMEAGGMYGFRHCWTLNLSARYEDLERAGFFDSRFRPYGYEDLDLGFRMMGAQGKGIYFEPEARVWHRHPMTFEDYLNREELLGMMTAVLFDVNREMFAALFGEEDLEEMGREFAAWTRMDSAGHGWVYKRMAEWNGLGASVLGSGAARERLIMTLYQMHVPLKRLAFRLGFLRGMGLRVDSRWRERAANGSWRSVLTETTT
jgi:hypothetical protein